MIASAPCLFDVTDRSVTDMLETNLQQHGEAPTDTVIRGALAGIR
ncbi:hypothetical protein [Methylobacterium sp.]|nr:hypothetical protein [Methylobacterium sp.]